MLIYRDLIDSETLRDRFKSATNFGDNNITVYIYISLSNGFVQEYPVFMGKFTLRR
jgi:hypothetical protein